jgi:hypothetical protein
MTNDDGRRLLSRAVKAEDDAQHLRARLAACYQELAATRAKVPRHFQQVALDQPPAPVASDPLVRLFAAIASPRQEASTGAS